jgi:hypothetical protein
VSVPAQAAADVPVALFVHRRYEQLPRTLECLRACGVKQLYVFSDGPRDQAEVEQVARVREILRALDWVRPITLERAENVGLSRSIRSGLDQLFETHHAAIVIEDDICVAPEFYDYACAALRHYEGSGRIAGITGLRYPFSRTALSGSSFDVFLSPRFSSWAWATWKDRWRAFGFEPAELRGQIAGARSFDPRRAGADMPGLIEGAVVSETLHGSWDVICAANMLLSDQYFVTPAWNMVENTGLADGAHSSQAPSWELRWEPDHRPGLHEIRFSPIEVDERVLTEYRRFFTAGDANGGALARARLAAARWRTMRRLRRIHT